MANVKISELAAVTSLTSTDVLPSVAGSTTSKITVQNLANSLTQVSSSISASFATTASYFGGSVVSSSYAVTSSFAVSSSWSPATPTFPFSGSAQITGSIGVTGSIVSYGSYYVQGTNIAAGAWGSLPFEGTSVPAFGTILRGDAYLGSASSLGYTFYYNDTNIGHAVPNAAGNIPAGAIKLVRQQADTLIGGSFGAGEGKIPIYTIISDNFSLLDDATNYTYSQQNGRYHVMTVSGSILSKNAVSLGSNLTDNHIVSGSINVVGGQVVLSGSLIVSGSTPAGTSATFQNGHIILSQVLTSLNFVDDAAAAAGGVPVGGLYRNGNFIVIRVS